MRLDALTLYHVRLPLAHPFVTSQGRQEARQAILIRLQADGLTAWGECSAGAVPGYTAETLASAWHFLLDVIAPRWLGRALPAPREFLLSMQFSRSQHAMTLAGFEMALWDAWGKQNGRSLRALLGGGRERVAAGLALGLQPSLDTLLHRAEDAFAQGYRRLKIKIAPGRDVQWVAALRRAFPSRLLQVDANGAYTLDDLDTLRALDDFSLTLIEQPFAAEDWESHRRLQENLRTPLCLDESITDAETARRALQTGVCRAINVKAARVGGLDEALRICAAARPLGGLLWVGGMLETGVGRAASLALASLEAFSLPADLSATRRYYARDITIERFTLNPDGTIAVPDGPGLGVQVDARALSDFTVRQMTVRADAI